MKITFFMVFALAVVALAFIIIPKNEYKKFLICGIIFGGTVDAVIATLMHFLNLIQYKNTGSSSLFGIFSFWTL